MENHIKETYPDYEGWKLLQNGGKLHVVDGRRSYATFAAKVFDTGDMTISPITGNLVYFKVPAETAQAWMAEARAAAAAW